MSARFRPCIDLHGGRVKQIVGGTLRDTGAGPSTNFVSELPPDYYARLYREHDLTGGHVIQLGPGNEEAARQALAAWPGGLQLGGGVTAANASSWLEAGADKVIVTSFVFSGGELNRSRLKELLSVTGRERLVLDLSCRRKGEDYFVVTDRWQTFTELKVCRETLEELAESASEFLVHAVDVEGHQAGIDGTLLAILAEHSPIDCVYAGGISSLADVEKIERSGRGRVHYTIGSALDIFGGKLSFEEIASRARTKNMQ